MTNAMYVVRDQHGVWHLAVFAGTNLTGRYPRSVCPWWQDYRTKDLFRDGEGLRLRSSHPATCIECLMKEDTWTT